MESLFSREYIECLLGPLVTEIISSAPESVANPTRNNTSHANDNRAGRNFEAERDRANEINACDLRSNLLLENLNNFSHQVLQRGAVNFNIYRSSNVHQDNFVPQSGRSSSLPNLYRPLLPVSRAQGQTGSLARTTQNNSTVWPSQQVPPNSPPDNTLPRSPILEGVPYYSYFNYYGAFVDDEDDSMEADGSETESAFSVGDSEEESEPLESDHLSGEANSGDLQHFDS